MTTRYGLQMWSNGGRDLEAVVEFHSLSDAENCLLQNTRRPTGPYSFTIVDRETLEVWHKDPATGRIARLATGAGVAA